MRGIELAAFFFLCGSGAINDSLQYHNTSSSHLALTVHIRDVAIKQAMMNGIGHKNKRFINAKQSEQQQT